MKIGSVDVEAFSRNLARLIEEGGQALAAYLKPREEGHKSKPPTKSPRSSRRWARSRNTGWRTRSARSKLQTQLGKAYLDLWASAAHGWPANRRPRRRALAARQALHRSGMDVEPVLRFPHAGLSAHRRNGRRSWCSDADGLDPHTRKKAEFYVRQITNALAPSNFVLTNPEVLRETLASAMATIWCAACRCWPRTSRPAAASCASASPTPPISRSASTWRRRPAR